MGSRLRLRGLRRRAVAGSDPAIDRRLSAAGLRVVVGDQFGLLLCQVFCVYSSCTRAARSPHSSAVEKVLPAG